MGIKLLESYETKFDSWVKELGLLKLPVRAPLTALHVLADGLYNGSRLNLQRAPRPEAGNSAAGRFSYLIPLLMSCDSEPLGEDSDNALQAVTDTDPDFTQLAMLVGYSHFCELMPEVHRGYYLVEGNQDAGFQLRHPSADFAGHEALDIVLSELSLSVFLNPPDSLFSGQFDGLARKVPFADFREMWGALSLLNEHYRLYFNEPPFLTEDGYRAATGVEIKEFVRFRAALIAMADFARGMASAIDRRIRREGDPGERLWKEMLEWISVCWNKTAFFGFLKGLSGLEFGKLERLVSLFSVDFRSGKKSGVTARDGFFPPIAMLEGTVLYNPDLLKLFMTARNIVFAVRHQDERLFNDMVSQHLEPSLVQQAADLLRAVPGFEVIVGRHWHKGGRNGELDMLVFSAAENVALHVQAKAAIPPQGARMVQTIEGRVREGLDQLKRLSDLPRADRDAVLSQALERTIIGVEVIDVLLSRSCFGTSKVWSQLRNVVPLNLTLLAGVTKGARLGRKSMSLLTLPVQVQDEINQLMHRARPQWVTKEAILGRVVFRLPMLEFDSEAVRVANLKMWADR